MKVVIFLLAGTLALASGAAESSPLRLVQTIPLPGVKGRFDHFAVDVKGQRLFVAALGNNTLEVVDLAAGKPMRSVAAMSKPTGVLYLPEGNRIVVANGDDGTVKILDGAAYKVSNHLDGLPDADNLRLDGRSGLGWLGYGEGALGVLDLAAGKMLGSVKLAAHPESFQLERSGRRIFVNVPDAKQIAVVDREKRALLETWPVEKFLANFPMALDEASGRLFAGCRSPARLLVLDTAGGKPVTDLEVSGDIDDLFYDAKRRRLYLSCGEVFIDVVEQLSANSYQRLARVPTSAGARTAFFCPELDRYYLAVPERGKQNAELRVFQAN